MIGRITVWVLLLGGLAGTLLTAPAHNWTSRTVDWVQDLIHGDDPSYTTDNLEVDVVDRINYARAPAKSPMIVVDSELETWLRAVDNTVNTDDLDGLVSRIQDRFPRYQDLRVIASRSGRLREMASTFEDLSYQTQPEINNVAIAVRKLSVSRGYEAIVVSGRRLDDFTPEALSEHKATDFFVVCTHCQHAHSCKVSPGMRGVILECPKCKHVFGVLAADDAGRFRYVNEYLTGYAPPCYFEDEGEKLHQLYTIWNAVVSECTYQSDATPLNPTRDSWQTALETLSLGHGDCEDSSLLLADWLISRGFQVRVALGRYGDLGQHAWCVVKIDNVDYLLESTEGAPDPSKPPYVSDVGSRYVPETLFDRDSIYVKAKPGDRFDGNYWSTKNWIRVQPRRMFDSLVKTDTPYAYGKHAEPHPAQLVPSTATRASNFNDLGTPESKLGGLIKLRSVPTGAKFWNIPVALSPEKKQAS